MDLISRQASIDALAFGKEMLSRVLDDIDVVGTDRENYSWGLGLIESSIKYIEELPSAEPEVVRCKDCKFASYEPYKDFINVYICNYSQWTRSEGGRFPDWYCARAERRTDETD